MYKPKQHSEYRKHLTLPVTDGDMWNNLTKEEQEELILSDIESEDESNLIPPS